METTISQALRRVAKLKGNLKELLERAAHSVSYTEGDTPAFSFKASLDEANVVRAELMKLETALRITNATTKIKFDGREFTLSEATCILQETKGRIAWLKALRVKAQEKTTTSAMDYDDVGARVKTVTVTHCDLPAAAQAAAVKTEQEGFDALNDVVETVNHRTMLRG